MYKLTVVAGPDTGNAFYPAETSPLHFGRSRQADCRLNDQCVSRFHCDVKVKEGRVTIIDLESTSGTFVNGQKISECVLQVGDVVEVGETQMCLEVTTDSIPDPLPPPEEESINLPKSRMAEMTGKKLADFWVGRLLAKADDGLVFKATDLNTSGAVALKVYYPEFAQNDDESRRFIRAMKTMVVHKHPNLVSVLSAGKSGPYCFVSMEYIKGENLTQVIQRIGMAGALDWQYALRVAYHVGKALEYARSQQMIHRNITPLRILVQSAGNVAKLGGLQQAKAKESTVAPQITKPGALFGDVRYMSPERSLDSRTLDERSDIYSLGANVYALLTGHAPCVGNTLAETLRKIRDEVPVKPTEYQKAIPVVFEGAVMKMLAKRPEDRYQTAGEPLKELEQVAKAALLGE